MVCSSVSRLKQRVLVSYDHSVERSAQRACQLACRNTRRCQTTLGLQQLTDRWLRACSYNGARKSHGKKRTDSNKLEILWGRLRRRFVIFACQRSYAEHPIKEGVCCYCHIVKWSKAVQEKGSSSSTLKSSTYHSQHVDNSTCTHNSQMAGDHV